MTAFAPTAAALEGLRLIRREPRSALVWMLLWLGFCIAAALVAVNAADGRAITPHHGGYRDTNEFAQRFGLWAVLLIALFQILISTVTAAVYRAILRPEERAFCFLRLGLDEARLVALSAGLFCCVTVFGGVPAYLLYVLMNPVSQAIPRSAELFAVVGPGFFVLLYVWLGVRLSLIGVETFAERRFHLLAYWPLARGRFWYLLWCYVALFFTILFCAVPLLGVGMLVSELAPKRLESGGLFHRGGLIALAAVLAVLTATFWAGFCVLLAACKAYAFRVIVTHGKGDVAIAPA
jgi:hypothetical protein